MFASSSDAQQKSQIIRRIVGHFDGHRWLQGYVRGKLSTDPAYDAVLAELRGQPSDGPGLTILDIGCGLGLLSFYLCEWGFQGAILGIDLDAAKIHKASEIARLHYKGLDFQVLDARDAAGCFSTIVALDVLHYLDDAAQRDFLAWMAVSVRPGGKVVLRNAPRDVSLRYYITFLEEIFVRLGGWIPGNVINFPTIQEVEKPFRDSGFDVRTTPLWGKTPFNSYLFVFTRPEIDLPQE